MATNIKQDLHRMAQAITINAHYTCNLGNLNILFQYQFYFDICQIIFPELTIQLLKIKENQKYDAEIKMDKLIDLLHHQLQIDLSSIKGAQVIKGEHISHLHRFLQVLEKFSQFHLANSKEQSGPPRVKSDPNFSQRKDQNKRVPRSARQKIKQKIIDDSQSEQSVQKVSQSLKKSTKKRLPTYSAAKKQQRSKAETGRNLYSSLVNIMMTEKDRAIKASLRDNRKNKNQQIIQAKNKYKAYLLNYTKQSRAAKNRQALAKPLQSQNKRNDLPLQDFQTIQDFFKSFQLKLRDQKYGYLKRIQKLVRTQQVDRMCYLNKIQQQRKKQVKKSTKKQLDRIENQHKIRNNLLKQQFQNEREANKVVKGQYQRYLRTQKKQLKENKKKQLERIKEFMEQENGKVLGSLQQGGRLEKVILNMYKRF